MSHKAAVKVPDGVSSAAAAVCVDAVMTSHHAVITRAGIKKGDVVFMFGLGGLGFNALQILLGVGCELYVSDVRQGPLDEAVKLGLPGENVVPAGEDVRKWVVEKGLENKIDIVVDFAGAQQTFSDAEVIGKSVPPQITSKSTYVRLEETGLMLSSPPRWHHPRRWPLRPRAQNQPHRQHHEGAHNPVHFRRAHDGHRARAREDRGRDTDAQSRNSADV